MGTYAVLSDAELVNQARAGDRNAFAVLYDHYFDGLHDFLTRMTRNRDEAAELVQETFLVAMQRLESLQQPARFKGWLLQIAHRRTLDRLEKQERWQFTSSTPGEDGETNALLVQASADRLDDPEEAAEAHEISALVWEAARSLDDRTFAVLDLHVRQGLSSSEIADVLDVKANHAYVLVNRMKERVGGAIGTCLLVRNRRDCEGLSATLAGDQVPPVTEELRKRVDRHVSDCDTCGQRRHKLLAPLPAYGALAAVPAAAGVKDEIWRALDRAWPTGKPPSILDSWRHVAAVIGAVLLIAVLPIALVLGLAGDGSAAPIAFDPLTASPVDRTPEAVTSFGVGPGLVLPPPPQYEPPVVTGAPTADPSATETDTPDPGIPPVVVIVQPKEGTTQATRQDDTGPYAVVALEGGADEADSAPENLDYAWSSDVEGPLGSGPTGSAKLHVRNFDGQCPLTNLLGTASTSHTVTLTVTDETGAVGQRSVEVSVEVACNHDLPSDDPEPSPSPTPTSDPSFTTSCADDELSLAPGGSQNQSTGCTANADEGFSGAIEWRCSISSASGGSPRDIACGMSQPTGSLADGGTHASTLQITASNPPPGEYTVTVTATVTPNGGDPVTKQTTVTVSVG